MMNRPLYWAKKGNSRTTTDVWYGWLMGNHIHTRKVVMASARVNSSIRARVGCVVWLAKDEGRFLVNRRQRRYGMVNIKSTRINQSGPFPMPGKWSRYSLRNCPKEIGTPSPIYRVNGWSNTS